MKNNQPLTEQRTLLLDFLSGNYWWCPNCQDIPSAATFEENCDDCGCGLFTSKPVMIGDVLLKLSNLDVLNNYINKKESRYKIVDLWYENGFAQSLNEILDSEIGIAQRFKNKNVQSLHNFLWGVFEGEITIPKKETVENCNIENDYGKAEYEKKHNLKPGSLLF